MISRKAAAALAVGMLVASSGGIAIAQQEASPGAQNRRQPPSPEVTQRLIDGRLAGTKAALKLTPDQEKLWPAVEQVIRQNAAERIKFRQELRQDREANRGQADMMDRLDRLSDRMSARAAELKRLADALKPLYATLSDDQKHVLRLAVAETLRGARPGREWGRHRG